MVISKVDLIAFASGLDEPLAVGSNFAERVEGLVLKIEKIGNGYFVEPRLYYTIDNDLGFVEATSDFLYSSEPPSRRELDDEIANDWNNFFGQHPQLCFIHIRQLRILFHIWDSFTVLKGRYGQENETYPTLNFRTDGPIESTYRLRGEAMPLEFGTFPCPPMWSPNMTKFTQLARSLPLTKLEYEALFDQYAVKNLFKFPIAI